MIKFAIITLLPFIVADPLIRPLFRPRYDPYRPSQSGKIVGGQIINITDTPWQISLQDRDFHICGGSIISPKFVLTACHCTDGNIARNLGIRAGSDLYKSGGIKIQVAKIHQHPSFNRFNIDYDFSILELATDLEFSSTVGSINLPEQGESVEDDTVCLVSGWGNTQSSSESRDVLRGALVPKSNEKECNKAYASFGGITARMICAGFKKGQVDACQGK